MMNSGHPLRLLTRVFNVFVLIELPYHIAIPVYLNQIGLVLQPTLPEAWGDLAFAVDYYEIEVKNGVARYGATNIERYNWRNKPCR